MENRSPLRVVLDTRLRLPPNSKIAQTAREHPTLVLTAKTDNASLSATGVEIVQATMRTDGLIDPTGVLAKLAKRGITRVLIEGGPTVQRSFLDSWMVDRLHLFRSPIRLGSGVVGIAARALSSDQGFEAYERFELGPDSVESYALTG
jgi:diaminohydroxyphosphoribosylaminopyrimidine deaminase/5-amino-6-(5-phosphoribosylamino)uracil reductase